jgi:predicted ATP-binding protein involved in virulence
MEELEYSIALKSLSLENFRCFDNLNINFDEKLTVFIAGNGGGKTAILDSIAESLKAYLAALHVKGYEESLFKYSDITMGRDKSIYDAVVDLTYPVRLEFLEEKNNEEAVDSEIEKDTEQHADISFEEVDSYTEEDVKLHVDINSDGDASFRIGSLSVTASFDNFASEKINKKSGEHIVLPVLCYYGSDSVQLNTSDDRKPKNRLDYIYKEALSPSRINFTAFELWFDEQYRRFLEKKVKFPKLQMQEIDPNLFKIINGVEIILNDDTNDKMYQDLRMDYEGKPRIVLGKQNEKKEYDYFDINQFSAGEKALFAFVADLGLRLLKATPLEKNIQDVKDVVVDDNIGVINGKGIVLIDEVDLHLHPKWQGKVVPKLMQIFPDIQWVMTTHSPAVLQNIPKGSARKLIDNRISTQELYTRGRDIESIYFDAFGQEEYPKEQKDLTDKVRHFYDIMDEGNEGQIEEAKGIIESLEQEWGSKDKKIIELKTLFELTYNDSY